MFVVGSIALSLGILSFVKDGGFNDIVYIATGITQMLITKYVHMYTDQGTN